MRMNVSDFVAIVSFGITMFTMGVSYEKRKHNKE